MEIKATIEQMSAPLTYKINKEGEPEREISYLEVVLNDGLNRFFCETASPLNAHEAAKNLKIGDTVEVIIKQRMGWKAVVIAYIVPLIVLVGTLAVLDMRMESEALAGVIALGVTGVYFIVLRLFRDKLQREFSFSIRKTE